MGYTGAITHLLTIDPNFQRDIQVEIWTLRNSLLPRWFLLESTPHVVEI